MVQQDPLKAMADMASMFGGLIQKLGGDAPTKGDAPSPWTMSSKVTVVVDLPNLQKAIAMLHLSSVKSGASYRKVSSLEINGVQHEVKNWKHAMSVFAGALVASGRIVRDTPVASGKKRYPIASKDKRKLKQRPGGSQAHIVQEGAFFVDTSGDLAARVRNMIAICEELGIPPSSIKVRLVTQ